MEYKYLVAGTVMAFNEPVWARPYRGTRKTEIKIHITRVSQSRFTIAKTRRRIDVKCSRRLGTHELRDLMLYKVIPRILAERGHWVIHASGVVSGRQAFLFAGLSGSGKSTLASDLRRYGHRVLADEALVVEARHGKLFVKSYPQDVRLKNPACRWPIGQKHRASYALAKIFLMHPDSTRRMVTAKDLFQRLLQSSFKTDANGLIIFDLLVEALRREKVMTLPFPKDRKRAKRTHSLIVNLLKSRRA